MSVNRRAFLGLGPAFAALALSKPVEKPEVKPDPGCLECNGRGFVDYCGRPRFHQPRPGELDEHPMTSFTFLQIPCPICR